MSHLLHHGAALLLLAAFGWLAGWVIDGLWLRDAGRELRALRRWCLGLGFWIAVAFLLAAAELLRGSAVLLVAVAVVVAAAFVARTRRERSPDADSRPRWMGVLGAILAGALLLPFFVLAASPVVSWDADTYHLTLPGLYLEAEGFRPVPMSVYAAWPHNTELLFALAMLTRGYMLAKLVHFGFGVLILGALLAGCRAFHRGAGGWLAMALLLANGVVAFELRVAYVDLAHAFFFLAAFLFMHRALDSDDPEAKNGWERGRPARHAPWLMLSGLCCGLMAGVKVNGIVGAAVIGALCLPRLLAKTRERALGGELRRLATRFALPILLLWAPWLARSAWLTGNPLYPLFHDLLGGPDWSPRLAEQLSAWHSGIGMGRSPLDTLLLPLRVMLAGGQGYDRFDGEIGSFWIVLLPLAIVFGRRQPLARRCLAAAGLYFVTWGLASQQMRLLIPVLPLLAIAAAVAVVELLDRLPAPSWRRAGAALAGVLVLALVVSAHRDVHAAAPKAFEVYRRADAAQLRASAIHPVYSFIGEELPRDARLLMLNTNHGFFCDREYLADSFFEASQIADWLAPAGADVTALRRLLADRGITHVVLENRPLGIAFPPALPALLSDSEQAATLFRSPDGRFVVFALR